jgi:hypothetical protein
MVVSIASRNRATADLPGAEPPPTTARPAGVGFDGGMIARVDEWGMNGGGQSYLSEQKGCRSYMARLAKDWARIGGPDCPNYAGVTE